jgi:hypothetical protein
MNYQPPKRRFESTGYVNPETAYYVPLENVTNADKEDMKTNTEWFCQIQCFGSWTVFFKTIWHH